MINNKDLKDTLIWGSIYLLIISILSSICLSAVYFFLATPRITSLPIPIATYNGLTFLIDLINIDNAPLFIMFCIYIVPFLLIVLILMGLFFLILKNKTLLTIKKIRDISLYLILIAISGCCFYFTPFIYLVLDYINLTIVPYSIEFIVTIFILLSVINFLPVFCSFYIIVSSLEDITPRKASLINILWLTVLVIIPIFLLISPNYIRIISGINPDIKYISGIDYNKSNLKHSILLYKNNTTARKELKSYYRDNIPLSKENFNTIQNYNAKTYFKDTEPITNFLIKYNIQNLNLSQTDQQIGRYWIKNTFVNIVYFAYLDMGTMNRVNYNKEALLAINNKLIDGSLYISDQTKCYLSLLNYKLGRKEIAQKYSTVDKKDDLCITTKKLLTGEIKKTSFKGRLLFNKIPAKNISIVLLSQPQMFIDFKTIDEMILYSCIIDLSKTDAKGNFELFAETDKPVGLAVFNTEAQKMHFNNSKLLKYKQGSTINLGDVILQ